MTPIKILIAEDNPSDAELLLRAIRRADYDPVWQRVDTEEGFLEALHPNLDLVLSDYSMPQFTGLRALELIKARYPEVPFIVVSGTIGEETAVETMRLGATDYLLKDRLGRLGPAINRALEQGQLRRERRKSEAALRASEESLAQAQHIAQIGSWELELGNMEDLNANPLRWSDELFRLFGYEPGQIEVTNDNFFRHVHPDDHANIQAAVAETLRSGRGYRLDHRIKRRDGTERILREHANLVRDEAGRPVRMIGTAQDITDYWRATEALRESELRLRVVTDNARVGLVMVNPARCYTFANATYAEILDLPSTDIVGRQVADVTGPLYEPQIRPRLDLAFAGERIAYELQRPVAGSMRYYAVKYEPAKTEGKVTQVVVVLTDITERKQAEELVRASEARYHALFDYAPDGIVIADMGGTYLDANASACRMFGYARSQFIGLRAVDIVVTEEAPHIAPALDLIKSGNDYHREWVFRRKDGTTFPADVIATAMPDGNLLAMIRDISERKQAEKKLREQLAELLRWQEVMLGREDRVQALKTEVNILLAAQKLPARYGPETPAP